MRFKKLKYLHLKHLRVNLQSFEEANHFKNPSASSQKSHDISEIDQSTSIDVSESTQIKDTEKSIDTEALKSFIQNLESKSKEFSEVELDYLIDTFIRKLPLKDLSSSLD